MIRRPYKDGWILIRQTDHAAMSGILMARWGGGVFASPTPEREVLFGIAEHDNGWAEWEQAPGVHAVTGYPLHFTELSSKAYSTIWRRGVERYQQVYPYASLLIALHTEFLACRRLEKARGRGEDRSTSRFSGEVAAGGETASIKGFIAEMETLRRELTDAVCARDNTSSDRLEAEIGANFRFLQIGDLLSLMLCCGLSGPFTIDNVPMQARSPWGKVTFEPVAEGTLAVSPSPFSEPEVAAAVPGRIIRRKVFGSDGELHDHLRSADPITLTFRLKSV